jgi:hypothetical protein
MVRDMSTNRESGGFVGGLIGGAVATLGLMKIGKVVITSSKQIIQPQSLSAGGSTTLLSPVTYKFAIILLHGDGDPQVQLSVTVGTSTYTIAGDEQGIELIAGEQVTITANNTDTVNPHSTPTIEIVSISW